MKLSVPFSTIVSTCSADMIILLLGLGCRVHLAPAPLPVGETGVARARAAGAEGDHPACTSGFRWWQLSGLDVRAEGRGDRRGRSRIFRDFTLARARAEPHSPSVEKRSVSAQRKRSHSRAARPVNRAAAGASACADAACGGGTRD